MTKDDIMIEWRKQRGAAASSSEIGRRPLHDNSSANNSEEYQPSSEPVFFTKESIICCKHGFKCSDYYSQKFKKEICALWPITELLDQVKPTIASPAISTPNKYRTMQESNDIQQKLHTDNQYESIFMKYEEPMQQKTAIETNREQLPISLRNNAQKIFPENISKLEILCRFYLGQKSRSSSILLTKTAQSFRLYHELPEDVNNLNSLKHYAPLYIIFINNDLEYRHLPVEECFVKGKRRLFVECGDKNVPLFKKLEYLVRHYANVSGYIDSQGRKSRFPDNPKRTSPLKPISNM